MGRPSTRWVWCEKHRKRAYVDPEATADALSAHPGGAAMNAYPCDEHPETSHLGHLSRQTLALIQVNQAGGKL